METERGGEEATTRRISQQKPSKRREDDWKKPSEGALGCRAELDIVRKLETRSREGDQVGFYKHPLRR